MPDLIRLNDTIRIRMACEAAWRDVVVGGLSVRRQGSEAATVPLLDLQLADIGPGQLAFVRYVDKRGPSSALLAVGAGVGIGYAHLLRDDAADPPQEVETMRIDAVFWIGGILREIRMDESGTVTLLASNGRNETILGRFQNDGTIAGPEGVGRFIVEAAEWAIDAQIGNPRLRRALLDPKPTIATLVPSDLDDAAPSLREAAAATHSILRDLLGRIGLAAHAVRLKDASGEEIRDAIVAHVNSLQPSQVIRAFAAFAKAAGGQVDVGSVEAPAAQIQNMILRLRTQCDDLQAQVASGGSARAALLRVCEDLGGDADRLGVGGAGIDEIAAECDKWIAPRPPALLPEVEIACPHCAGQMLITPDLLKPEA